MARSLDDTLYVFELLLREHAGNTEKGASPFIGTTKRVMKRKRRPFGVRKVGGDLIIRSRGRSAATENNEMLSIFTAPPGLSESTRAAAY
ncbi:hypothetical protein CIB48_g4772 [Xylaria polymorpha]|nr:hypothetical protein CIB48_g4772 [Xylaria polymorpha]